jgi:hypothetical protein
MKILLFRKNSNIENFEKDPMVENILKKDKAIQLREAYYSYLLSTDILKLGSITEKKFEETTGKLKSLEEMRNFEGKKVDPYELLSNEGLNRYYPRHDNIDYFYTGFFINNLLWSKRKDILYYDI